MSIKADEIIGQQVDNGAVCIAITWHGDAVDGEERGTGAFVWQGSPHPYVVWSVTRKKVDGSDRIDVWNGSYMMTLDELFDAYNARGGKSW